jgi:serine/threonine protein kinase
MLDCVAGRRAQTGLPVRVVRRVAEVLCAGLTHLHDVVGVAHLDVKPENVLLVSGPGDPTDVVLCDFGAAHHLATQGGRTVDVVGTPRYMAPELYDCRFSAASDAYSLGTAVFCLLTARRPPAEPDPAGLEARMRAVCASDADRRFVRDVARLTAARPCDRAPHASLGAHF